jgi:hypothetical protein
VSGFTNPIVGGGGNLIYPSIHSPNYVPGVSGWAINKDGTAEFNDVDILGTITGSIIDGATIDGSIIEGSEITSTGVNANFVIIESVGSGLFVYAVV